MTTIEVGNVYSRVAVDDDAVHQYLDNEMSMPVHGSQFSYAFKLGKWDGKRHFYHQRRHSFPTGLLDEVIRLCPNAQIVDKRQRVETLGELLLPVAWQQYLRSRGLPAKVRTCILQWRGVRRLLRGCKYGLLWNRGVYAMATGSGKTATAALMLYAIQRPALYLVPTRTLLHQTCEVLSTILEKPVGRIGDQLFDIQNVTVSTVQSAARLLQTEGFRKYLQSVEVLIVDECHHVSRQNTWLKVAQACPAYYRVGFSGTPLRRHDIGDTELIAALGPIVFQARSESLIKQRLLASVTIHMIPVTDPSHIAEYDWRDAYQEGIVDNYDRNQLGCNIAAREAQSGKATLLLVRYRKHGRELADTLELAHKVRCTYIDGMSSKESRLEAIRQLESGELQVLVASGVFDEGVDVPNIRCLVLGGGGKSEIRTIQRIGRGLRLKKDGGELVVYDFLDKTNTYLLRHSEQRIITYRGEGFPVVVEGDR